MSGSRRRLRKRILNDVIFSLEIEEKQHLSLLHSRFRYNQTIHFCIQFLQNMSDEIQKWIIFI